MNTIKKKFQTKSNRVKGLHPSRPWILVVTSQRKYQYMGLQDSKFSCKILCNLILIKEHDGPVRALSFHPSLPIFVSGGDDTFIKIWNYKQKKCLFTLTGHVDYIRTTFFHNQLPLIISSSDDQIIRIWNYQSRTCINMITGHSHFVMCAQFHPTKDFIVSCSLDTTVRIWDYSNLKKKLTQSIQLTSFIGIEIPCIRTLEGHSRGVNWVCFHPIQNFVASASDDRTIKLWKYTNEVAWQHSTIHGHKKNVSCVIFDSTGILISNSEDSTIRFWNIQKNYQLCMHKMDNNQRYWILSLVKNNNLLAAGHDQGFEIFSIKQQNIPYTLIDSQTIIYARSTELIIYDIKKNIQKKQLYQQVPKNKDAKIRIKKLFNNPFENNYYMVQAYEDLKIHFVVKKKQIYLTFPIVITTYQALDSCFVSQSQCAALISENQIQLYNLLSLSKIQKFEINLSIYKIFSYDINFIIITTNSLVALYSIQAKQIIKTYNLQEEIIIKKIVKSYHIALLSKNKIIIIDQNFNKVIEINEKNSIKSAFWQRQNLLFYTTNNHWKYALLNGQTGILKSLEQPLYFIKRLNKNKFLAYNDKKKLFQLQCQNFDQLQFKLTLIQKYWNSVRKKIKQMPKNGKTILRYLIQKDYSTIALDMVEDKKQKFSLAINSSQFQLAYDICNQLNSESLWKILGQQALKQGIYNVVEVAYKKLQKYDQMSFLYLIQGNYDKLAKILKLSQKLKDPTSRFNNSLILGDHKQKILLLYQTGHQYLAALSAKAYNLTDLINNPQIDHSILKKLGSSKLEMCKPLNLDFSNWPHNQMIDQYLLSLN